jgi:hypothetical protein
VPAALRARAAATALGFGRTSAAAVRELVGVVRAHAASEAPMESADRELVGVALRCLGTCTHGAALSRERPRACACDATRTGALCLRKHAMRSNGGMSGTGARDSGVAHA